MTSTEKARRLLDNWQFWMILAYAVLAVVVVALWVNFGRESRDQARTAEVVARRHADVVANAEAQYEQCVKSIPSLTKINRFLRGVQDEHRTLLKNALAAHAAQPKNTALWHTQLTNIERLRRAFSEVRGVRFPIPTKKSCSTLRARLLRKE